MNSKDKVFKDFQTLMKQQSNNSYNEITLQLLFN